MALTSQRELLAYSVLVVYEQMRSERSGRTYRIPGGQSSKYWPQFVKTAAAIRKLKAPVKEYLAAQFEGVRGWTKVKYPYPNMLWNIKAQRNFIVWKKRQKRHRTINESFTKTDKEVREVSEGETILMTVMRIRNFTNKKQALKDPLLVNALPKAFLRQSNTYQQLRSKGYYLRLLGNNPV